MAAPTLRGVSATRGSGTTSAVIPAVASIAAGDLLFIIVESSDSTTAAGTPNTPSGWTKIFENTMGSGATDVTTCTIFAKIAAGGEGNVTVDGVLNHIIGSMAAITTGTHGVSTLPTDLVIGSNNQTTGTTGNTTSSITVTADSLICWFFGITDDAADTSNINAYTNSNLASITKQFDEAVATGAGGGVALVTGTCAGTSTGAGTWTHDNAVNAQSVHIGVKPAAAAAPFEIQQYGHRFFEDGTETGSTAKAGEDQPADISDTADENIAVRIGVHEVGGGTDGATTDDYQLQYSLNGGTWTNVTSSSSVVKGYTSANLTDAAATTQRNSAGSGTWIAGEISETDGLLTDFQLPKSRFTELLFAITTVAADITTGDSIDLRLLRNGAVLDAYNVTPTLDAPAPPQTLENHFDGTDGTVLTQGSGGNTVAGGNYFDTVNGSGTAPDTIEFDTGRFHSGPSSVLMNSTNTGNEYVEWTTQLTDITSTLYVRAYLYVVTGIASSANKFIRVYDSSAVEVAFMGFDATPRLRVGDSAGTFTEASSGTFTTGAWYRLEMAIPVGNSVTINARLFTGANIDGTSPDHAWAQTTSDTSVSAGNIASIRFGNSIAVPVIQLDDVAISTSDWVGPYVVAAGQTVFMGLPIF